MAQPASMSARWVWQQVWSDLLFLHWPVDAAQLRPHLPRELAIDTWRGEAWVSLVLFRLQVRPWWLPGVPGLSSLVEANLRTYVTLRDRPGIYFLSIHADNRWAMALARLLTPLPYERAAIGYEVRGLLCTCQLRAPRPAECQLSLSAAVLAPAATAAEGTHEDWLLERYRAYVPDRRGVLQHGVVTHDRWQTHPVQLEFETNTLGRKFGLDLDRPPGCSHFCPRMAAKFSRFQTSAAERVAPDLVVPLLPQTAQHSGHDWCPSGGPRC